MTFKVRKIAPVYPEQPYSWDAQSKGQCTWYAYYRAIEVGFNPPCWWDRATLTGSYTNAKDWLENYRDPWEVKGPDYTPTAGDIAVFDGNYGHVAFIERNNNDGTCTITDYNRVAPETFALDTWKIGVSLTSTGKLIGYLHWPTTEKVVNPVKRDITRDQIKTTDTTLRIRSFPSLNGKIVGHIKFLENENFGYQNVLGQTESDGYTWYKIDKDRYCANITTEYLPAEGSDILAEIERYLNAMSEKVRTVTDENTELKTKLDTIAEIADYNKKEG